jgi:hypothetical protein
VEHSTPLALKAGNKLVPSTAQRRMRNA